MVTLTITVGLPGAGKSTWCEQQPEPVVTLDAIRDGAGSDVLDRAALEVAAHLDAGRDVILDGCSLLPRQRAHWRDIATRHGATTRVVLVHVDPLTARTRNAARPRPVPPWRWRHMLEDWQRARYAVDVEGWAHVEHIVPTLDPPDEEHEW